MKPYSSSSVLTTYMTARLLRNKISMTHKKWVAVYESEY